VLGQHIRNLVDGVLSRQRYSVEWDGTSDAGVKVATGIYFYRMATQEYQETRKMVLIK
jgi:flagellar hook assembly protein FlgD